MLKIRRPLGRLIFNMGIAIPGKTVFLIETAPWCLSGAIREGPDVFAIYVFITGAALHDSFMRHKAKMSSLNGMFYLQLMYLWEESNDSFLAIKWNTSILIAFMHGRWHTLPPCFLQNKKIDKFMILLVVKIVCINQMHWKVSYAKCWPFCSGLNSSLSDKMVVISQMAFWNAYSWMESFAFWFKLQRSLFLRVNWQQLNVGSGNGLAQNRRQTIIWTSASPVHWLIYAALGGDELMC